MFKNKIVEGVNVPQHIAIIMDGNGRWAKKHGLPRSAGHKKGVERMIGLLEHSYRRGVKCVTLYALSTENLKRPQEELNALFSLMRNNFQRLSEKAAEYQACFRVIGNLSLLPPDIQELLRQCEAETAKYTERIVNMALCYGARDEIVRAVNLAVEKGEKVNEESFESLLYTNHSPALDLMIRTGKEVRLSNFLLYQAAYAELYFSDKMFPAFSDKDLDEAILSFSKRTRRFGKTDEQIKSTKEK